MTSTAIQAVIDIEIYLLIFLCTAFSESGKNSPRLKWENSLFRPAVSVSHLSLFCNVGNPYICTFLLHLDIKLLIPFICDFYSFLPIFRSLT